MLQINEIVTIEGVCQIERKTNSWRIVNGTVLEELSKKDNDRCVGKKVRVKGSVSKHDCNPPESQCYGGDFMNVKSIEYID